MSGIKGIGVDAVDIDRFRTVLQRTPLELPYPDQEAQGEIFVWMPDGSYLLLSERLGNAAPKVHCYRPLP